MKEFYFDRLKKSVKVGDTVIIKSLAEVKRINEQYKFPFHFAEGMYEFCGERAKVIEVGKRYYGNGFYYGNPKQGRLALDHITLDIDKGEYSWSLDMFQWKHTTLMKNE